ncbi:hypothetical protein C496_14251 [Natronorubrum tibetense GA33]|uniref:TRAM domain-containing protein n=1 Tax=Natronorubrum tibetense GA33 TaxID=1114856 RepID=L9VS12_9EURY|nr:hypothetical protein C496_14251 [Natronorubrum tibetense GA33]
MTVGLTAIIGAAKLISKLRSKADDEEETPQDDQESDEANASESDTQSFTDETATHSRSSEYNSSEQKESWEAHKRATRRSPPVELGEVHELGVEEVLDHHTGKQQARGKIEGFQVFVDDVPSDIRPLDMIRVKILSYGRGRTSAEAKFLERM